jgi:hypothetical protein
MLRSIKGLLIINEVRLKVRLGTMTYCRFAALQSEGTYLGTYPYLSYIHLILTGHTTQFEDHGRLAPLLTPI